MTEFSQSDELQNRDTRSRLSDRLNSAAVYGVMAGQPRPVCHLSVALSLTLAISGKAEIWSVEYDVVEGGTIDGGCKAWIVANTLWIGMSAGEDVGQNILEHWEIDGYDNAAGDSK